MIRWYAEKWSGFDWIPIATFKTEAEAERYAETAWQKHKQLLRVSARNL